MYAEQADLSKDPDFRERVAACSSKEGFVPKGVHATIFADSIQWEVAGQPGLAEQYASALAGNIERPGRDPAVITDEQILAAVTVVVTG